MRTTAAFGPAAEIEAKKAAAKKMALDAPKLGYVTGGVRHSSGLRVEETAEKGEGEEEGTASAANESEFDRAERRKKG